MHGGCMRVAFAMPSSPPPRPALPCSLSSTFSPQRTQGPADSPLLGACTLAPCCSHPLLPPAPSRPALPRRPGGAAAGLPGHCGGVAAGQVGPAGGVPASCGGQLAAAAGLGGALGGACGLGEGRAVFLCRCSQLQFASDSAGARSCIVYPLPSREPRCRSTARSAACSASQRPPAPPCRQVRLGRLLWAASRRDEEALRRELDSARSEVRPSLHSFLMELSALPIFPCARTFAGKGWRSWGQMSWGQNV